MEIPKPREFSTADVAIKLIGIEPIGHCLICGQSQSEVTAQGYDYELLTCKNRWEIKKCTSCGHHQLDPRPSTQALSTIYPSSYYSYDMKQNINPIALKAKAWLDRKKFKGIIKTLGYLPQTYLDIGCGDAHYLDALHTLGVPKKGLFGIELNATAVANARLRGYTIEDSPVELCNTIAPESLDLVTMFHVIEHVSDPLAVIKKIYGWLKPRGLLVIETPNIHSLDARLFEKTFWGGYHFPRHWHLFHRESLEHGFKISGFKDLTSRFTTGHSFWMYSFHHCLRYNKYVRLPRLARLFNPLRNVVFLAAFTVFDIIRGKMGFSTSAILVMGRKK